MKKFTSAGNRGEKVRSDCYIEIELKNEGGINLVVDSKVDSMYGNANRKLLLEISEYFGVKHASVYFHDTGALPFVIAARMEAAIKELVKSELEYLPEMIPENHAHSDRGRLRQTRLYLPGNTPAMMINAGIHHPHGIILDLEDSVAPGKKDEARILVRNALRQINFYGAERMVRINQLPLGIKDIEVIASQNVNLVLLPKCEDPEEIYTVEKTISESLKEAGLKREIFLMPIIESCLGVENAFRIATASKNVVAMAIGLEDYTADLGVERTKSGEESLYARTRIVNACKAAGIQPIDSVFSDVDDNEALAENVRRSKALGFEGMGCIHPRQVSIIHDEFKPTPSEIERAQLIVKAYEEAKQNGLGVVAVGSKMIDAPVVKRAMRILNQVDK